jgi:hypothetical protein
MISNHWYFADELCLYAPTNAATRIRIEQPPDLFVYPISQKEIRVLIAKPPLQQVTFRLVEDLWIPHHNAPIPSTQLTSTSRPAFVDLSGSFDKFFVVTGLSVMTTRSDQNAKLELPDLIRSALLY